MRLPPEQVTTAVVVLVAAEAWNCQERRLILRRTEIDHFSALRSLPFAGQTPMLAAQGGLKLL